jgi:hypothetical protein
VETGAEQLSSVLIRKVNQTLFLLKKNWKKKNDESLCQEGSVCTGPSRCTGIRGGRQLSAAGYSG